jgi:hypothetical protein
MAKTLTTLCVVSAVVGFAGVALAANTDVEKRPDPSSISFIDGYGESAIVPGTTRVMGRLFFHKVEGAVSVEYRPSQHPDPTATKIVLLCTDNAARIEIPIGKEYLGPVPSCPSLSHLKFASE